jgi:hypothetical protein
MNLKLSGWASIAEVLLSATAFLALVGAIFQILSERWTARAELTYNYTERFANSTLLPYHQKTANLFRLDDGSGDERYADFQNWKYEDQLAALLVPNLFEELAGMYGYGLVDKKITKEFFGDTALGIWQSGYWFVERSRRTNPRYYEQWELMLEDMGLLPGNSALAGP